MSGPTARASMSIGLLALAAIAAPLLAFWPEGQDPGREDWARHVEKACEARRFGIRVAAARKVAGGGDAAVPALRAYEAANGRNALPSSLVDTIAVEGVASDRDGDAMWSLLLDWASDDDFYWRASALRGLALRAAAAVAKDPSRAQALAAPFAKAAADPAWLTRTHARFGLALLDVDGEGRERVLAMAEPDPRARVRLASLLLDAGVVPPLQPLFDALADERTFLGSPWGSRLGQEANGALRRWLGDDYVRPDPDDRKQSIAALRGVAERRSGQEITQPEPIADRVDDIAGGIEILSCKHGDVFVQWTADGVIHTGIDGARSIEPAGDDWPALRRQPGPLALEVDAGVVVCDSLRIWLSGGETHVKVAPQSLPAPATDWLKQLADTLEEAGAASVAADLRRALAQFAER